MDYYKITIHKDADGENDGVRVQVMDEDFLVALEDNFGGDEVTFKRAANKDLPDTPMVIAAWSILPDINDAIKEAGGKPMSGWYWTKSYAELLFGDEVSGRVVFDGRTGNINHNYDFFLCEAKSRYFIDLRKEEED